MAVKYFNKQTQKWEIFPGTAGISAYEAAQEGGYKGTEEEFNAQIANFETILRKEVEITNSADDVHYPSSKAVKNYVDSNIKSVEVVDNLTTENASKALSANQGKILNDNKLDKSTYTIDKTNFVTKEEIPDITNLATKTELVDRLNGKASKIHTHSISDVIDLQTTLDIKADKSEIPNITDLATKEELNNKANKIHSHVISDITNLQNILDNKADTTDIPNITDLVTNSELTNVLASKADKSELPDISNLATKDELKENNLSVITYTTTIGTDATANKSLFDSISSEETLAIKYITLNGTVLANLYKTDDILVYYVINNSIKIDSFDNTTGIFKSEKSYEIDKLSLYNASISTLTDDEKINIRNILELSSIYFPINGNTTTDLNEKISSGTFSYEESTSNSPNNLSGTLIVFTKTNVVNQLAWDSNDNIWNRQKIDESWAPWKLLSNIKPTSVKGTFTSAAGNISLNITEANIKVALVKNANANPSLILYSISGTELVDYRRWSIWGTSGIESTNESGDNATLTTTGVTIDAEVYMKTNESGTLMIRQISTGNIYEVRSMISGNGSRVTMWYTRII